MRELATQLGISNLSPVQQGQIVEQFGEVALKAATVAVLEKMPQAKQDEFATLAEAGDGAQMKAFLDREVPGHEQIAGNAIATEIANFRVALAETDMAQEDGQAGDEQ